MLLRFLHVLALRRWWRFLLLQHLLLLTGGGGGRGRLVAGQHPLQVQQQAHVVAFHTESLHRRGAAVGDAVGRGHLRRIDVQHLGHRVHHQPHGGGVAVGMGHVHHDDAGVAGFLRVGQSELAAQIQRRHHPSAQIDHAAHVMRQTRHLYHRLHADDLLHAMNRQAVRDIRKAEGEKFPTLQCVRRACGNCLLHMPSLGFWCCCSFATRTSAGAAMALRRRIDGISVRICSNTLQPKAMFR